MRFSTRRRLKTRVPLRARGKSACRCTGGRRRTPSCWISSVWSLSRKCCMALTGSIRLVSNRGVWNMQNGFISKTSAAALMAVAFVVVTAVPASAQATKSAAKSSVRRMPDGHPDLQGTYDLATMTPMERFPGDPPVLTKEQAATLQKAEAARRTADGGKLDPNRGTLPVGGDHSTGKSYFEILEKAGGGAVGGYDRLWLNQGTQYMVVDGQIRTSIVIDPPDGKVPPANSAGRQRGRGGRALPTSDTGESQDVNAAPRGQFDDP